MEKALFHEDSDQPPLNPLLGKPARPMGAGGEGKKGWLYYLDIILDTVLKFRGNFS